MEHLHLHWVWNTCTCTEYETLALALSVRHLHLHWVWNTCNCTEWNILLFCLAFSTFILYQPNPQDIHACLEVRGKPTFSTLKGRYLLFRATTLQNTKFAKRKENVKLNHADDILNTTFIFWDSSRMKVKLEQREGSAATIMAECYLLAVKWRFLGTLHKDLSKLQIKIS